MPYNTDIPKKNRILRTKEDWSWWSAKIQGFAEQLDVWIYIDPDSDSTLTSKKPARFDLQDRDRSKIELLPSALKRIRNAREARLKGTRQTRSRTAEPTTPEKAGYLSEHSDNDDMGPEEQIQLTDLTNESCTILERLMDFNACRSRIYEETKNNMLEVRMLMSETISPLLERTCMPPGADLRQCYKLLFRAVGESILETKERIIETYGQLVYGGKLDSNEEQLSKTEWLAAWEIIMSEVQANGPKEILQPIMWYPGFLRNMRIFEQLFAWRDHQIHGPAIHEGKQHYTEVISRYRNYMSEQSMTERQYKIERGAFASMGEQESSSNKNRYKRERAATNMGEPTQQKEPKRRYREDRRVCEGCDGFHRVEVCYYVYPKKAPDNFRYNPTTKKRFERMMKEDSAFKEKIFHLRAKEMLQNEKGPRSATPKTEGEP